MITLLKRFDNNTISIVNENKVNIGDTFELYIGNKMIMKAITNIFEQRPEKGTYKDESKRRMFAKISYE